MRDLPVRKNNRLKGYDYSRTGCYFVTVCVKDRHELLGRVVGGDAHIAPFQPSEIAPFQPSEIAPFQPPEIAPFQPSEIALPVVQLNSYGATVRKYIDNINIKCDGVHMDKYVIMPNHIHMILSIPDHASPDRENGAMDRENGAMDRENGAMWASPPTSAKIPQTIRSMKILVTKEIGFSLWQESYHEHIIRNEAEYRRIWQYIDENPARWAEDKYYIEDEF